MKSDRNTSKTALSRDQQIELDRRLKLFNEGKMLVRDWKDVYEDLKSKLSKKTNSKGK